MTVNFFTLYSTASLLCDVFACVESPPAPLRHVSPALLHSRLLYVPHPPYAPPPPPPVASH
eukprot:scaffold437_cov168-Ochromonas_danica.AAC.52